MSPLKSYTVAMIVSEVWHITVDAASEDEAKAQAHASYIKHGNAEFSYKNSDVDGFLIIDEEDDQ
jgi:hypothetical protein